MPTKRAARDRIISDVERGMPLQSRTYCPIIQMEADVTDTNLHPYVRVELQRITSRDEYLYHGQILQHIKMEKKVAKYEIIIKLFAVNIVQTQQTKRQLQIQHRNVRDNT
jgi:hypothetical protein